MTALREWHAKRPENPLSPDEEIVDAHHHLWAPLDEQERPLASLAALSSWLGYRAIKALVYSRLLGSNVRGFYRMHFGHSRSLDSFLSRYLAQDLKSDFAGLNIIATVYVQCGWSAGAAGEVTHQLASRERHGLPTAVVAELTLQAGPEACCKALDDCLAAAGERGSAFLVGFRSMRMSPSIADAFNGGDPRPYDCPKAIAAARAVGSRGFVIDLCGLHTHLHEVRALAAAAPQATFVLDHMGFPVGVGSFASRKEQVAREWRASMTALASACPNVSVKLSGVGTPVYGFDFPFDALPPTSDDCVAAWAPYVHFTIQTFGVDRCFFASNFPVDAVSCSYVVMWNAFKKLCGRYTAAERRKLLRDNAIAVYGLQLEVTGADRIG